MEEILASIRRIISEDEAGGDESAQQTADRETGERSMHAQTTAAYPEAPGPRNGQSYSQMDGLSASDDGVLELTEMIAEDGSVVTIGAPQQAAPGYQSEAEYETGHGADDQGETFHEVPYESDASFVADDQTPPQPSSQTKTRPPAHGFEAPVAGDGYSGHGGEGEFASARPAGDRNFERATRVLKDQGGYQTSAARGLAGEEEAMDDAGETYESARVGRTPGSAFAELAGDDYVEGGEEAAERSDDADTGFSSETESALEDLIRQAVQPMLREWLEQTLPDLVERIVRQEIKKLIERRGGL